MAEMPSIAVRGVLETVLYARDLDAAERLYREVVGLAVHSRSQGRHVFFRCGGGMLLVFNPEATRTQSIDIDGAIVPRHGADGPGHTAFRVRADELKPWRQRLEQAGVEIESDVAWPGGGRSLYVRDPAGNSVEFATPTLWGLPQR